MEIENGVNKLNDEERKQLNDLDKIENMIFEGALTHASILRCESELKKLKAAMIALNHYKDEQIKINQELENKMQSWIVEFQRVNNAQAKSIEKYDGSKKPYKCPVCDGCGSWVGNFIENSCIGINTKEIRCMPCEGKGIVWG